MTKSPYLNEDQRLTDVIAAIQATANYRYYKLDFKGWSDRITGDETEHEHWKKVFQEHPEFFRLDSKKEKASLIIRRQHRKRYDVDTQELLTFEEYQNHHDHNRVSRTPLSVVETNALIQTAIELHSRAVAKTQLRRWWIPVLSIVGGFAGAILGAILGN